MKLAFSTLGCPDFDWSDIYSVAKDFGFAGIEMRGLGDEIFSVKARPFRPENIAATVEHLHKRNLEICCLSSGCSLKYGEREEETYAELLEYIELARKLKTPFIRILGDEKAAVDGPVDDAVVLRQLRRLAPVAEEAGVTLLVETNGVYADTDRL